jgi:Spx/MgsR family transcriptional regulator
MVIVYGLKNCDSCRAARAYLKERDFVHEFHDLREDGLDGATLDKWIAELGWEPLLNKKSTTWRGLDDADKADLDAARARALMLEHPTLVKRPVIDTGRLITVGFDREVRAALQSVL